MKKFGRFSVLSDGKIGDVQRDFGGAFKRYVGHISKLPNGTKNDRFYVKVNQEKNVFTQTSLLAKTQLENSSKKFFPSWVSAIQKLYTLMLSVHFS